MAVKVKRSQKRGKRLNRSIGGTCSIFVIIALCGAFMVLPLIYAISNSLKPLDELWMYPPRFFVENPTIKNFRDLFLLMDDNWIPFSRYFFNTALVAVCGTGVHLIIASLAAYAFSKMKFKGRNVIFNMVVLSLMFTSAVTSIPIYLIMAKLNLIDTYWALILPAFASPLGLYLMKQFMETSIPDSLLEAAKIDGSTEWGIFWKIVMPLVKPAWLTLIIFSFQGLWNIGPSVLIQSENLKTLNYALSQIVSAGVARQGTAAAATIVMMFVPVLMFVISQSKIVETVATSGMKD